MNTKLAAVQIQQTYNYKQFKLLQGNRAINERKVKKIIDDIDDGLNMLPYVPIVVDKDFNIIDGQHRYSVSKILKQPVYFVVADEKTVYEIAKINSRTERWKKKDFLECYLSQGNVNYMHINKLIVDYAMTITSAVALLHKGYKITEGGIGGSINEAFERGTFVARFVNEATHVAQTITEHFEWYPFSRSTDFVAAVARLLVADKVDWPQLKEQLNRNSALLTPQPSSKAYLSKIEEIYNYGKKQRRTIY
ncbi:MAG: hypothetical protein RL660_465 [Bacteroidota bacterium]|jgi:hypothetical protein